MIRLYLEVDKILSKQRARSSKRSGRHYHAKEYTDYLQHLALCFSKLKKYDKESLVNRYRYCLAVRFNIRKTRTKLDLDNMAGAVLDGLVYSGALTSDDSIKHFRRLFLQADLIPAKNQESIELYLIENRIKFVKLLERFDETYGKDSLIIQKAA